MSIEAAWWDYDVIVVGSGGAGSAAAQAASELQRLHLAVEAARAEMHDLRQRLQNAQRSAKQWETQRDHAAVLELPRQ